MPSFEMSKLQGVSAARALAESDRAKTDARLETNVAPGNAAAAGKPGVAIEVSNAVDPGQPPVDTDRVAEIRKALQDGSYPLLPTQIADAMIAARVGFGLES